VLAVFSLPGVVAVAGSRVLPASGFGLVVQVLSGVAGAGGSLVVGCCSGADAAVLSMVPGFVPPSLVRCLCAFGPGGVGSGPASAVAKVSAFASSGGSVQWWAGGPVSVPLHARLAGRTRAVVAAANAGLVVFFCLAWFARLDSGLSLRGFSRFAGGSFSGRFFRLEIAFCGYRFLGAFRQFRRL
jgi:hypothetical protein